LGKPKIEVIPEVAYGLDSQKTVDWISVSETANGPSALVNSEDKLLLVGGCELLQLASYCSSNRTEFVNKIVTCGAQDYKVRYDDPYFFLTDRDQLDRDEDLKGLAAWTRDDALLLDRSMAEAKIVMVAMRAALNGLYVRTKAGTCARIKNSTAKIYLSKRAAWFQANFATIDVGLSKRFALIQEALEVIDRRSSPDGCIFVMGASAHTDFGLGERVRSDLYNKFCRAFCRTKDRFHFVDVMDIVPRAHFITNQHLTPAGHRLLSIHILDVLRSEARR
jgi:hypothetical protein